MSSSNNSSVFSDEQCWNVLMDNVKDYGIFLLDCDGRIVTWNAGAERMFGYSSREIIGQPFTRIFTPQDADKAQPEFELREAREKGRSEDERWHVRKDRTQFWASGVVTPLWDPSGELQGFAKVVRDITERKRTELALTEANRRKDEFLAMLSHELRNPLGAIISSLELIKLDAGASEMITQSAQIIDRQSQFLVHMVDDLLDISRISSGNVKLHKERVELQAVIRHAVETTQPLVDSRQHEISLDLPEEAIWIDADPHRLEQVFANLVNNAAKYTDPGGAIRLELSLAGNQAIVRVTDNGGGILSEMLPRIFDLFVQADRTLDRSQGGLGIGLTLVKRIVEIHGGKVEANSAGAGLGSEFVVWLPVVAEIVSLPVQQTPGAVAPPPAGRKVLVAEDNEDTAQSLALILRKVGHEVFVANTGTDALRLAHEHQPDVVLLDIGLPGMDGFRVAENLRQQPELAGVQLIAMTGYGQEEDFEKSRRAGFDEHLVKPVKIAGLLELLSRERNAGPGTA